MKKIKNTISMVLVIVLLLSLTSTTLYADETNNPNVFDQYLSSKGYDDLLTETSEGIDSTTVKKDSLSSDEYLKMLKDKGVDFEVKDTYYMKVDPKKIKDLKNNNAVDINGEKYVIVDEVITVNAMPAAVTAAPGDTRVREVKSTTNQTIATKQDHYDTFILGSIMALAGYQHPLMGFVTDLAGLFSFPPEEYGTVKATTVNSYQYTNVWHEVYDYNGFYITMFITESRRTNVTYQEIVTNEDTGQTDSDSKTYNAVRFEYSQYYGQITRNLNYAVTLWLSGLRNPEIDRYYTGDIINNYHILP